MSGVKEWEDEISYYFEEGARVRIETAAKCKSAIIKASDIIAKSLKSGGKLLLCGNGGSAADCQHMAAEFVCRLCKDFERPAIPAIALTTDTSFITAYGNDYCFDGIFSRQVEALGKPGDCLIGISTSGSSRNVVLAVQTAKRLGLSTITLCGAAGELQTLCDASICVPSTSTQFVQEAHLAIEHILCGFVERKVYGRSC
jgi:phosphoheptose isomerase